MALRRHPASGRFATRGQGGVLNISRRSLEKTARSAVTHIAAKAREMLLEINNDLADNVQWMIEDEDACETCQELDEQIFPIGEGPRPPEHINCRCFMIAVFKKRKRR